MPLKISIDGGASTLIVNPLSSSDGDEWDTYTAPVVIPAGATSITTRVVSYDDGSGNTPASLIWVFTALVVPPSFVADPAIDIEKTPDLQTVPSGSDVTFTIVVTNTGNVDLINVEVTDVIAPDCDNLIGNLDVGASVTYDCTLEDVTADLTNVAVVTGEDENGNDVTDDDDADVVVEQPAGGEGCTPGYWKQEHHFDSWVGYSPSDDYETEFGVDASFTLTLLDTLKQGGGGEKALGRHAVAALLNAASSGVSYEFTEAEVIALVQNAYTTGDFDGVKNTLEQENERGCPLGRDDGDDGEDGGKKDNKNGKGNKKLSQNS